MTNIQYADDGIYTVNFYAEDDCGNRATGVRTINVRERQFTISFDSKGGSVVAAILVNEGDDATGFTEPTKEGVAFKGWYDNPYCYGDPITIIEDVQTDYTLYAKWGDESYGTYLFGYPTHALVINCPESKKQEYISTYGAIYEEYPAWSTANEYDFNADSDVHWAYRRGSITTLIIGSNVKPNNLAYWFYGFDAISDVQGMDKIDASRCVSMKSTFEDFHYRNKSLDISMWDVRNVQNFVQAFSNAYFSTLNVSTWITSSATNMRRAFANMQLTGTQPEVNMVTWEFGNVTDMYQMFAGSTLHTIRFGNPDTSNVTTFYQMFAMCAVTTIYSDDFDTSSETSASSALFNGAQNLVGGNGTAYDSSNVNSDYAVVDMPSRAGYFTAPYYIQVTYVPNNGDPNYKQRCTTRTLINLPTPTHPQGKAFIGWHYNQDFSDPAMTSATFYHSVTLYGEWEEEDVSDTHMLFYDRGGTNKGTLVLSVPDDATVIENLKSQYGSETRIYTNTNDTTIGWQDSSVRDLINIVICYGDKAVVHPVKGMFSNCYNLEEVHLDYLQYSNKWSDVGQTKWESAFENCINMNLISFPSRAQYGVGHVWDCTQMFYYCAALTTAPTLPCEDISNATAMFNSATGLRIAGIIQEFKECTSMYAMFRGCLNLETVSFISTIDTVKLQNMAAMFYGCEKLTTIDYLEKLKFGTYVVPYDCQAMFYGCKSLTSITLAGFTMAPNTLDNFIHVFWGCTNLRTIKVPSTLNLSSFARPVTNWCDGCSSLVGSQGTSYDISMANSREYARIDGGTARPGLFSPL